MASARTSIGASSRFVEEAIDYQSPFYDFFRVHELGPLSVGENFAFPGRKLHGVIDEVSFWSRALAPDEAAGLARAPAGDQPGLIASYRFDGNAEDRSASKLDGQLVGGAVLISPATPRTAAKPSSDPAVGTCPTRSLELDQKSALGPTPGAALSLAMKAGTSR